MKLLRIEWWKNTVSADIHMGELLKEALTYAMKSDEDYVSVVNASLCFVHVYTYICRSYRTHRRMKEMKSCKKLFNWQKAIGWRKHQRKVVRGHVLLNWPLK